MILSVNGTLSILAAYANILTIATFLGIGVNTTRQYATHPFVKILLLYVFAYSVINDKLACLFAVALFTVIEVREFVTEAVEDELVEQEEESAASESGSVDTQEADIE